MASLFQGTPQTATSYTTSSTETPKWMQDAIYNQIQWATGVANTPYQAYEMPRVAELSPLQQQAYQQVQNNQGFWQQGMDAAQSGTQALASKGTADALGTAQSQYLRQGLVDQNLNAGQDAYGRAAGIDIQGAAQPYLDRAAGVDIQGAAQPYFGRASSMSALGAAQPYMGQSASTTAQALSERALSAANPYLNAAAQTSVSGIGQYMNPYNDAVTNRIADLGVRNLQEKILPSVSDAFIKAGQFGSSRMGEMGARALRDTQEAILGQQAQALQQGYGQAMSASQADLARQAGLAGTVGSISGADLSRVLQGAGQYGQLGQMAGSLTGQDVSALVNMGQSAGSLAGQQAGLYSNLGSTAGSLAGQQMSGLTSLGNAYTNAGQTQQQFGLNSAQALQQAQAQDYTRQLSALQQLANQQQQEQQMRTADVAALDAAGLSQQNQMQRQLDTAYSQYQDQQLYPKQQLDWLNTQVRGMAPITPTTTTQSGTTTGATYSPSPLSQLASGLYVTKGLTG